MNIIRREFEGPIISFDFYDVSNPGHAYLGQGDDYKTLHEILKLEKEAMLFGVSRGAATGLIELGTNDCENVTCGIFESPFDKARMVIRSVLGSFASVSESIADNYVVPRYVARNYDPKGVAPIDVIDKIPKDKPIFLFCSEQDKLISYKSTINIYKRFLETGHIYLLITKFGAHADILWGPDGLKVRNTIHAFLEENNLSHNTQWATNGRAQLKLCRPTLQGLNSLNL